jgi:hypothetical protein
MKVSIEKLRGCFEELKEILTKYYEEKLSNAKKEFEKIVNDMEAKSREVIKLFLNEMQVDINIPIDIEYIQQLYKEFISKYMCYFEKDSKNFAVINITSKNDSKYPISALKSNLSMRCGFCHIPENIYFAYGFDINGSSSYNNSALMINIETQAVKYCKSNKLKGNIGECQYYQGSIYCFGGYNASSRADSEKYTIDSDEWTDISPLPNASHWNRSLLYENLIMITGYYTKVIFKYDIGQNIYTSHGYFADWHKVLCRVNDKIFVFCSGNIYESSIQNMEKFEIAGTSPLAKSFCIAPTIQRGIWIYFLLLDYNIYRFNVLSKKAMLFRPVLI